MLKFIFSILFVIYSINIQAQDWSPFKMSDTIAHFVAEDSMQINSYQLNKYIHPIQSIVVDSSFTANAETVVILKKGYSSLSIPHRSRGFSTPIKGQILGDSFRYDTSFIIASTIDSAGFKLKFPFKYHLNKSWLMGESPSRNIIATVVDLDTLTVTNYGLDSIVTINLLVQDTSSTPTPGHIFNNSTVIISKNIGLLSSPNFTSLDSNRIFNRMPLGLDSLYKENLYRLNKEDDYVKTTYNEVLQVNYNIINYKYIFIKVLSKNIQGDSIILKKSISVYNEYTNSSSSGYNKDTSFVQSIIYDTLLNYAPEYSCIIEDSMLNVPITSFNENNNYGLCYQFGKKTLVNFKRSWVSIGDGKLSFPTYFPKWQKKSNFTGFTVENTSYDGTIGSNAYRETKESILYLKQGNKTYGHNDNFECVLSDTLVHLKNDSIVATIDYAEYQWLDCGQNYAEIQSETDKVYQPSSFGSFAVKINIGFCLDTSRCITLVGLNEYKNQKSTVTLFPNPVNTTLSIKSKTIFNEVFIYNQRGQIVFDDEYRNQYNVSSLPSGLYILKLIGNQNLITTKFIKQ